MRLACVKTDSERVFFKTAALLFPVAVSGSAQFGLNRTEKGWWLWAFNNRGIRKFADAPQEIDHSFDSELEIDVSRLCAGACRELLSGKDVGMSDGRFCWRLPAGELAVFELGSGDGGVK